MKMKTEDPQRFWSKVLITPGCWQWMASTDRYGYGHYSWKHRVLTAHRYAYEFLVEPIPDGLHIDHLCRNRACVNPNHLEPVTKRENTLRGMSQAAQNARMTHCAKGHEFNEENTRYKGTRRSCRICWRERQRIAAANKKAERDA